MSRSRKERTNLWDYLTRVAEEKTERKLSKNELEAQRIAQGTDLNALVQDAVSEYGDDVLGLAVSGLSAYTGMPLPAPSSSASSEAAAPVETSAAPTRALRPAGSTRPMSLAGLGKGSSSSSSAPSWLWPAIGIGVVLVLARGRG